MERMLAANTEGYRPIHKLPVVNPNTSHQRELEKMKDIVLLFFFFFEFWIWNCCLMFKIRKKEEKKRKERKGKRKERKGKRKEKKRS